MARGGLEDADFAWGAALAPQGELMGRDARAGTGSRRPIQERRPPAA